MEDARFVQAAAYLSIGLSIINLLVITFFVYTNLKGVR